MVSSLPLVILPVAPYKHRPAYALDPLLGLILLTVSRATIYLAPLRHRLTHGDIFASDSELL